MRYRTQVFGLSLILAMTVVFAKYKIKPLEVKPAAEYASHLTQQQITIGVFAADTEEKVLRLFDSKKVFESKILPVLIVVDNNNDFPLRIMIDDVYLIHSNGANERGMSFIEAFLNVLLNKPLSSYSTDPRALANRYRNRNKELYDDFQHKSFGEKIIPPHDSDRGVAFFWLPEDGIENCQLYIPELENMSEFEELMFFELPLLPLQPSAQEGN